MYKHINKRSLIAIIILALIPLMSAAFIKVKPVLFPSFIEAIKVNWNIDFPKPAVSSRIASNVGGFPMEGDSYYIFKFNNNDLVKLNEVVEWEDGNIHAQRFAEKFLDTLLKNDGINQKSKNNIKNNLPDFTGSYKYFYKIRMDSSIVFLYMPHEGKIYVMESTS